MRAVCGALLLLTSILPPSLQGRPIPDDPFWQDTRTRIQLDPGIRHASFRKVCVDKEGVVYVLTDLGVARVFDEVLAHDRSFRPLADRIPRDIAVSPAGELYYLFEDSWVANGNNGRPSGRLPHGTLDRISVGADGEVWLAGAGGMLVPGASTSTHPAMQISARQIQGIVPGDEGPPALVADERLYLPQDDRSFRRMEETGVTAVSRGTEGFWVGTTHGLVRLNPRTGEAAAVETGLPWAEVTALTQVSGGLWVGTTRGAFFMGNGSASRYATPSAPGIDPPRIRYYAGPRWLPDDDVLSLAIDPDGNVWVLTRTGLTRIGFRRMTLADKAEWFHRKIRSRNLRFGLTAERRLPTPGDLISSEMVDTDNDGGWTSYYLGALGARYAVTHDASVRREAWESFGALERLQELSTVPGFSARTIERRGFKFSDPDRWRPAEDPGWDWKGHTSSDEICSQTFAHAIMWEWVATNAVERARVATNYVRIVDHILDHDLHYVDVDGQPTLWGRWNPEYLNGFPHSIHDRRLNSAEITASLQLAFRMTGNRRYRDTAFELFQKQGYLTNLLSPMTLISATPGYVHQGNEMGDEWNHSDDELAFFTYWVLCRFAFTPELKAKYLAAVADHWAIEKAERYPIWNFIYAACGAGEFDAPGAVWTLRGTPMDTLNWPVRNSNRGDITPRAGNFMKRELEELLPPGERLVARINTQPFILDGGDGLTDFPGDEFLIGYWLGRKVGAISGPRP